MSGKLAFRLDELGSKNEVLVEKPSDVIFEILYSSSLCRVDSIVSLSLTCKPYDVSILAEMFSFDFC